MEDIKIYFLIAFIVLIILIGFVIWNASQDKKKKEPPQPARLVKGTVRSVIALAITYLIFLLALTDFLIHQRIGAYLTAAFTAVIAFYFGSRAIEAFYARKTGFSYSKTSADGSKEKIEGYETSEAVQKLTASMSSMEDKITKIAEVAEELKLGSVRGKIAFPPDVEEEKAGVKVTLAVDQKVVATVETDSQGYYFFPDVPSGTYVLKAEKEGYDPEPVSQDVKLTLREHVEATKITLTKKPK